VHHGASAATQGITRHDEAGTDSHAAVRKCCARVHEKCSSLLQEEGGEGEIHPSEQSSRLATPRVGVALLSFPYSGLTGPACSYPQLQDSSCRGPGYFLCVKAAASQALLLKRPQSSYPLGRCLEGEPGVARERAPRGSQLLSNRLCCSSILVQRSCCINARCADSYLPPMNLTNEGLVCNGCERVLPWRCQPQFTCMQVCGMVSAWPQSAPVQLKV
jgi:hypothetical protein